jgi:HTH-type transcriptional regulator / antitoxin HigA
MATKTKTTSKAEPKVQGERPSAKDRNEVAPVDRGDKKKASSAKAGARSRGRNTIAGRGTDLVYLALIQRFPLRPIRTEAELDAASGIIDELTDRDDLSVAESDYLDVLGDLVEKYEDENVEMPHVSDAEMLRCLMNENGVRQAEVVRGTGISKTVLSLVLSGKRDLTREHIETLAKYFGVHPAAFLGSA